MVVDRKSAVKVRLILRAISIGRSVKGTRRRQQGDGPATLNYATRTIMQGSRVTRHLAVVLSTYNFRCIHRGLKRSLTSDTSRLRKVLLPLRNVWSAFGGTPLRGSTISDGCPNFLLEKFPQTMEILGEPSKLFPDHSLRLLL